MKKIKNVLAGFLLLLGVLLAFPTSAIATHQNMGPQYGDRPIYGHLGQPHGYVISGDFTFIVSVHGEVDRVIFKIVKASDINKILGTYSQTSVTNVAGGDKLYNLVWNSTGFEDGEYKLFVDIESDKATPNGWRDFVVHMAGQNHLGFYVKNPKEVPLPPTSPPENTCSKRLNSAKTIAGQLHSKHNANMTYIDNFFQQTTLFAKKYSTFNHDEDLKKISEIRKGASDSVVTLGKLKEFTCDQNLKEQINNYLKQSNEARNKLDDYKNSVINLMVKVLGEVQ